MVDSLNFPSNSREKPKEKKIEKVVSNEAKLRKKPVGSQLKEMFSAQEFKSAAHYILTDVIIPAAKNVIVDATNKGIQRIIYGGDPPSRSVGYVDPRAGMTAYNKVGARHPAMRPPRRASTRREHDGSEIVLATRAEAETVVGRLQDIVDMYETVSVADLYELVGLKSTYVDQRWGWSGLHDVSVRQVREGFLIDLPPAEPI